jgi:hypothetical protein
MTALAGSTTAIKHIINNTANAALIVFFINSTSHGCVFHASRYHVTDKTLLFYRPHAASSTYAELDTARYKSITYGLLA